MEILGIGVQEIIFILIIALIVLGPRDMQKAGRTIGRWLNQMVRSDFWKVFQKTSTELRNLPRNLMREANLDDLQDIPADMKQKLQSVGDEVNKEIQEIHQTIDPRSRPAARTPTRRIPPEGKTDSPPQPMPTPNPAETPPQPPATHPIDPNDNTKQDE